MFILDGKPLPIDTPFQVRGTQYPANWLRLSTSEEKAAIGITEVADQPRPDDRYYWVSQKEDGSYTAIPKALEDTPNEDGKPTPGLKSQCVGEVKTTAGTLLAPTDWKVIRAAETGGTVSASTLAERAAIRDKSNLFEEAILATDTVEELIAVMETINWSQEVTA